MLGVQVVASWEACSLAKPMFNSVWQEAEEEVRILIAKDQEEKRMSPLVNKKLLEKEFLESEPAC
jgi:hypothetical protein